MIAYSVCKGRSLTEVKTISALHYPFHRMGSCMKRTCGQDPDDTIECDQVRHNMKNLHICGVAPDLQRRLKIVLSKMHGTLLAVQEVTESCGNGEWEKSQGLTRAIADACRVLEDLPSLPRHWAVIGICLRRIDQYDCQNSLEGKYDGDCQWEMLAKAIEQCEVYRDESEICLSTAEQETPTRGRYEINLFKRSWQPAGGRRNYADSTPLTVTGMLICSIAAPFFHWTLIRSLHLEPQTRFDETLLHNLPFLQDCIQVFEPHPTLALVLLLLSIMMNVGSTFTLARNLHKSERPPIYACILLTIILGAFSKSWIGFSTPEYFLVFLPFLEAVGAGAGVLLHHYWPRRHRQREITQGRHYSSTIQKLFSSRAGSRPRRYWCVDYKDDTAQGHGTKWQQVVKPLDKKYKADEEVGMDS